MTRFTRCDRVVARALVWALMAAALAVAPVTRPVRVDARGIGQASNPAIIVNGVQPPDTLTVSAGQSLSAGISNGPASTTDWVGLYQSGATDGTYLAWKYLSNTTAAPATGLSAATVTFDVPAAPSCCSDISTPGTIRR